MLPFKRYFSILELFNFGTDLILMGLLMSIATNRALGDGCLQNLFLYVKYQVIIKIYLITVLFLYRKCSIKEKILS